MKIKINEKVKSSSDIIYFASYCINDNFKYVFISIMDIFSFDGAYNCSSGSISKWNLLYYTIISFTTIGYGDICPTTVESQAVAILISITSVICLIIFVSSLLSAKNDILGNKEKEE